MYSRPQYTDLTYMGGTRPFGPMSKIFGTVIKSWHKRLTIKFGVHQTYHVLKTPVYRFDLYGRYQTLWTDEQNFWYCYLELEYKPKYQVQCESDVPCVQEPSYRFDLYWRYQILYSPFSIPTSVWVIEAYVQIFKSVALCVRTQSCLLQTDEMLIFSKIWTKTILSK